MAEMRRRMSSVRADDVRGWGRMTAEQMMRHLGCACEVALGARPVVPVHSVRVAAVKWVALVHGARAAALRSGFRWPKNIRTTRELELAIAEDVCQGVGQDGAEDVREGGAVGLAERGLRESVDGVDGVIDKLERVAGGRQVAAFHPMFGRMSAQDWMRWGYLHTDHHLRQFGR